MNQSEKSLVMVNYCCKIVKSFIFISRKQLTYILSQKQMNTFKSIFSFAFTPTPEQLIRQTLAEFQINSNASLPNDYYSILFSNASAFHQLFSEVVKSISKITNAFALIKFFTIIFKTIREKEYDIDALEQLEKIEMPQMADLDQKENSWLWDLLVAIKSYLARLSSVEDVYKRALSFKSKKKDNNYKAYLSDLYRLLNVYGLLFPGLTASLNIIGRYYLKTSPYYQQFYNIMKKQILLGYEYIEDIVTFFKMEFKQTDICTLNCFLKTIPEIELYCDRTQEFLMNKYFKGRGPNKKIYFKQEQISEIAYQVQSLQEKSTKSQDIIHTSDQEDFGEFQQ